MTVWTCAEAQGQEEVSKTKTVARSPRLGGEVVPDEARGSRQRSDLSE